MYKVTLHKWQLYAIEKYVNMDEGLLEVLDCGLEGLDGELLLAYLNLKSSREVLESLLKRRCYCE